MSRWKRRHHKSPRSLTVSSSSRSHSGCLFISGHPLDSYLFRSMTIGPPIPEMQFDLEHWRSKTKVKSTASQRSVLLTHFLRVSHQGILSTSVPFVPWHCGLPFPRYNLTLTIQGQSYPSQRSIQMTHLLSVSHQAILVTSVPFVPW